MEKLEARENGEQTTIMSQMSNPTRKKIKKLFLRRLKISSSKRVRKRERQIEVYDVQHRSQRAAVTTLAGMVGNRNENHRCHCILNPN